MEKLIDAWDKKLDVMNDCWVYLKAMRDWIKETHQHSKLTPEGKWKNVILHFKKAYSVALKKAWH